MPDTPKGQPGVLNKKLGGIKGKWWLVGGVATAGVAYVMYSRSNAQSADDGTVDPSQDPAYEYATGGDGAYGYGDGYGTSGFGGGGSSGSTGGDTLGGTDTGTGDDLGSDLLVPVSVTVQAPHTKTNRQWQHDAIARLEEHGYTAHQAKAAVAAYLAGLPLTTKEEGTIQAAVRLTGPPPEGAPVVHHEPAKTARSQHNHKPKPKPKHPIAKNRTVHPPKVKKPKTPLHVLRRNKKSRKAN